MKQMLRCLLAACVILAAGTAAAQTTRGLAYVANNGVPGAVSVIDNATATLIATIPVGAGATRVLASPDNTRVYVSNSLSASVSVISTLTTGTSVSSTALATVPVGNNPGFMTVTPNGSTVFVSNQNDNTVSAINTTTFTSTTIPVSGLTPRNILATPDGLWVYLGYTDSTFMSVISTATLTEVATIQLNSTSRYITVSPDSSQVYVSLIDRNEVGVIDTATMTLVATPAAGYRPNGIAITPDGKQVFSANLGTGVGAAQGSVVSFTTSNDAVTANIPVGALAWQAVMSNDGKTLYTASSDATAVYAIDTATLTLAQTIPVGTGPYWTTISNPDGTIYCSNPAAGTISVVNATTGVTLATIKVGGTPWSSAYVNGPVVAGGGGPPQLNSVTPSTISQNASVAVSVGGSGFENGATLSIAGAAAGVALSPVTFVSANQLDMTITTTSAAPAGPRNLTLTNPDGTTASLIGAFKVTAAGGGSGSPTPTSVTPNTVDQGTSVVATIKGAYFKSGATVSLKGAAAGVTLSSVNYVSANQLGVTITATSAAATGPRNLVVTNPDGTSGTLVSAFLVFASATK